MEPGNTGSLPREEPEEEKRNDAETPMSLLDGEGRNEEASGKGPPGREAAAAEGEGAGELSGEGPSAADGEGFMDDWNQEGASGGNKENGQRPQELVPKGMGGNEAYARYGTQYEACASYSAQCTAYVRSSAQNRAYATYGAPCTVYVSKCACMAYVSSSAWYAVYGKRYA
ncbi:hypothetical protein STEG23_032145 [Scotinomys teguina]